jgi:hypothetical protein
VPKRIDIGGKLKHPQILRRITLAWILLVVVGSLKTARLHAVVGPSYVGVHREIHWLAFGGTAFLLLLLCRNRRQEIRSVIATCLLGLSLEYSQHLIYHIAIEWRDVRDDAYAILVAFALYRLAGAYKAAFPTARSAAQRLGLYPHAQRRTAAPTKARPAAPSRPRAATKHLRRRLSSAHSDAARQRSAGPRS